MKKKVSALTIMRMRELRQNGCNNREIAEKTGFTIATVIKYIGPQPEMLRAEWASRSAYVKGA